MRSLHDLMSLTGRVAAITGGAGHIGRAAAAALAELGASVVLLDLPGPHLDQAVAALQATGSHRVWGIPCDLADEAAIRGMPAAITQVAGRLDILVHSAALVGTTPLVGWTTPFEQQSSSTWRQCLEINLTAPFTLTQACYPLLRASTHGSVVMISSIYGMVGPDLRIYGDTKMGNPAAYAASKGGLVAFTRWLATTLAPDVRANVVTAGGVWRRQDERFIQAYTSRTPLGRMANEEDFVGAIAYLASDASAYVTGHNLVVDGGWTAW